ncbi:MAG TPA: SURF1 family protein [Candidatus Acidoferrales bacterium]|nr:SURF1 family protein [Candidatus Acidoferrales bacterium]
MRPRTLLAGLVCLALAGVCARLGFWQLTRWSEKRHDNATLTAALRATPESLAAPLPPLAALAGRRIRLAGRYDAGWSVVLDDRWRDDAPGVELVTPLRLAGGGAVLVDRGWLASADAVGVADSAIAEPGEVVVTGVGEGFGHGRAPAWSRLVHTRAVAWSARRLDSDSLRAHLPYPVAPWALHALPDSLAPRRFVRELPLAGNEGMHLSYAVQWGLFAAAFVAGALFLASRDRAARRAR